MRRFRTLVILVIGMATLILSACSSAPRSAGDEPSGGSTEIEVTRLVEVEVTKLVDSTVEVTRIVTQVREVTPTPPPTETPSAPKRGNYQNPYSLGETAQLNRGDLEFEFTVLEIIRGEEAQAQVLAASEDNSVAPPGMEYIIVKTAVEYSGEDEGVLTLGPRMMEFVSDNRIHALSDFAEMPTGFDPPFGFKLLPGGEGEGWLAWIAVPDSELMLKLDNAFFALNSDESG